MANVVARCRPELPRWKICGACNHHARRTNQRDYDACRTSGTVAKCSGWAELCPVGHAVSRGRMDGAAGGAPRRGQPHECADPGKALADGRLANGEAVR